MAEIVINTKNLDKSFGSGETEIHALKDVNLEIMRGDFAAIVGPSGNLNFSGTDCVKTA